MGPDKEGPPSPTSATGRAPACPCSFSKLEASWLGPCASVPGRGARSHAPGSQLVRQVEPAKEAGGAWHLQLNNGCCGTEVGAVVRPSGTHRKWGWVTQSPEVGTRCKGLRVHTRPHVLTRDDSFDLQKHSNPTEVSTSQGRGPCGQQAASLLLGL